MPGMNIVVVAAAVLLHAGRAAPGRVISGNLFPLKPALGCGLHARNKRLQLVVRLRLSAACCRFCNWRFVGTAAAAGTPPSVFMDPGSCSSC